MKQDDIIFLPVCSLVSFLCLPYQELDVQTEVRHALARTMLYDSQILRLHVHTRVTRQHLPASWNGARRSRGHEHGVDVKGGREGMIE